MEKPGTKTGGDTFVPFGERVERALMSLPPRIDTPIQFPTPHGNHIDTDAFRNRHWLPAFRATGIRRRRLYDLRHTCASLMLKSVPPAQVAHILGTSIAQLDATYSHYMPSGGAVRLGDRRPHPEGVGE